MGHIAKLRPTAILAALSLATATSAKQPAGFVTFTIEKDFTNPAGSWAASGAVTDHGICCIAPPHFLRGISGVVRTIDVLEGENGTISLRVDTMFNGRPLGNNVVALEGAWRITGGTGAYAGASGNGQVGGTYNQATEVMHAVNSGVISLAPSALEFREVP
jgi:hypothetical protein